MSSLSVIVPVYNVENYLKDCLDSLVQQNLENLEIICVDDGSTDKSWEILQNYSRAYSNIRIFQKENGGLSSARNYGLKYVNTEWVTFVDSDDIVDKNAYSIAMSQVFSETDVICYGIKIIDVNKKEIDEDNSYYDVKYKGEQQVTDQIIFNTDFSVCNKIFRVNIIKKFDLLFPDKLKFEDAFFCPAYLKLCKKAFFIDKYLYFYRRREFSIMHELSSVKKTAKDMLYITFALYDFLIKHNLFKNNKYFYAKHFFYSVDFTLSKGDKLEWPEYFYIIKNFISQNNIVFSNFRFLKFSIEMLKKEIWNGQCIRKWWGGGED